MQPATSNILILGCIIALLLPASADQLDEYIQEGLENNLSLRQQLSDRQSADESLYEARSQFFPSLWFKSRYTRADGGRSVTIPVGEILLESFRNSPLITQSGNVTPPDPVTVYIMPETEQETKLQLTQPLFAPALVANYRMNRSLLSVREMATQAAALTLIRDIRLAYYTCLQAAEGKMLYDASCKRSGRQLYTAQKLFEAGMLSESSVLGAQAEHARNETALARSRVDFDNACKAFNLLLNRPLETPPTLVSPDSNEVASLLSLEVQADAPYDSLARLFRPELRQLEAATTASRSYLSVEKSGFAPTLAAAFEGGIIGDRFEITDRSTFYTASVLLQWELFSGLGRMHKIRKAHAAIEKIEEQRAETAQRIRLQVEKACSDLELAQKEYRTSGLQLQAADKNYLSVLKRFDQGAATSTEMTEAGVILTKTEVGRSVARYELFKQQAHLFYAAAMDIDSLPTRLSIKGRKK